MPTSPVSDYKYYEAALAGSSGAMTKDAMARRALDLLDRVQRVLILHTAKREASEVCNGCGTQYPCPTIRALTGV